MVGGRRSVFAPRPLDRVGHNNRPRLRLCWLPLCIAADLTDAVRTPSRKPISPTCLTTAPSLPCSLRAVAPSAHTERERTAQPGMKLIPDKIEAAARRRRRVSIIANWSLRSNLHADDLHSRHIAGIGQPHHHQGRQDACSGVAGDQGACRLSRSAAPSVCRRTPRRRPSRRSSRSASLSARPPGMGEQPDP